jgi:NUMOD3 motif
MAMPRRRPLRNPKEFYAYIWRYKGEVIYVGQGRNNRGRPTCKSSWSGRCLELRNLLEVARWEIDVEILPCKSEQESVNKEKELITALKPRYNRSPSRGGFKGMHTPEGLERIRQAATGRECSEELRHKRSERMVGNTNLLGHVHTEETRKKMSEASKGKPASELCKQKARERMIERNKTNPPRLGKKLSEEHRRKLSEAAKRRNHAS